MNDRAAMAPTLAMQRLTPDSVLPTRAHDGDAGLDLVSCEHHVFEPGARASVGTGVAVAIPQGFTGLVCPRSGLALRHGIALVNAPGVIDAGYRGELRVVLLNTDQSETFTVQPGDRIAQLLLVPVLLPAIEEVADIAHLGDTARADRGFGSTGIGTEVAVP